MSSAPAEVDMNLAELATWGMEKEAEKALGRAARVAGIAQVKVESVRKEEEAGLETARAGRKDVIPRPMRLPTRYNIL